MNDPATTCGECGLDVGPGGLLCPECLTPTLRGRQWRALKAVRFYREWTTGSVAPEDADADEVLTAMGDLVADLMHLADLLPETYAPKGVRNWSHVMANAHMHHQAEAHGTGPYADAT